MLFYKVCGVFLVSLFLLMLVSLSYHFIYNNIDLVSDVNIIRQYLLNNTTYVLFSNNITVTVVYPLVLDRSYDLFISDNSVNKITYNSFHLDYLLGNTKSIVVELALVLLIGIILAVTRYTLRYRIRYVEGYNL